MGNTTSKYITTRRHDYFKARGQISFRTHARMHVCMHEYPCKSFKKRTLIHTRLAYAHHRLIVHTSRIVVATAGRWQPSDTVLRQLVFTTETLRRPSSHRLGTRNTPGSSEPLDECNSCLTEAPHNVDSDY